MQRYKVISIIHVSLNSAVMKTRPETETCSLGYNFALKLSERHVHIYRTFTKSIIKFPAYKLVLQSIRRRKQHEKVNNAKKIHPLP